MSRPPVRQKPSKKRSQNLPFDTKEERCRDRESRKKNKKKVRNEIWKNIVCAANYSVGFR